VSKIVSVKFHTAEDSAPAPAAPAAPAPELAIA